jgi:3-hydroxyisobutyrate dehydrogenase
MLEAVSGGAAASWQLLNLAPKMIARDFRPGFKVWHQEKDLRLALEVARETALPLPATALVSQLFASLHAAGLEDEGTQALVKALEALGQVDVGEWPPPVSAGDDPGSPVDSCRHRGPFGSRP